MGKAIPRLYVSDDEQAMVREFLHRNRGSRTERLLEDMNFFSAHRKGTAARLCEALDRLSATIRRKGDAMHACLSTTSLPQGTGPRLNRANRGTG
jgi:hypothetical protein